MIKYSTTGAGPYPFYADGIYLNPTSFNYPDPWTSNDDIALLGNLRTQIAGSSFNAAVTAAEAPEALWMIKDAATRIAKFYVAIRKGNLPKAAKALLSDVKPSGFTRAGKASSKRIFTKEEVFINKRAAKRRNGAPQTAARNWLELQYGWLPLLSDAEAGAQFLAHQTSSPFQYRVTATRFAGGTSAAMPWVQGVFDTSNANFKWKYRGTSSSKRIIAFLREKDVVGLSGLKDPLSVVWELLPYSFVVDWFIPIGNYLQARGLSQALTGTFITCTLRKTRWKTPLQWGTTTFDPSNSGPSATAENYSFSRVISTNLAVPLPEVKGLNQVPSWRRAANAVSLLLTHR
jgi:hypothetical protein